MHRYVETPSKSKSCESDKFHKYWLSIFTGCKHIIACAFHMLQKFINQWMIHACVVFEAPMMTSSNGNIFRATGPMCGEFTGHRWIPCTKSSDTELWFFFDLCLNKAWVNNRETGDLRRHPDHYDIIVMSHVLSCRCITHIKNPDNCSLCLYPSLCDAVL